MTENLWAVGKWAAQPVVWAWGLVPKGSETVIIKEIHDMLPSSGRVFFRIAGISGAAAIALGAYGAHEFREHETNTELVRVFETANRYHMATSLALLAAPIANRPYLAGTLLSSGVILFSGSCYWHAMSGNKDLRKVTPYGGMLLIAGFAALAL